jgi:glycosyltransferase involved in cell wall biosynthesis
MITVVIPTHNAQAALTRCFDSLIGPTVRGVVKEVIVADGGSTDDTLFIADAAGAHVLRGGKTRASRLAAGAKAARGDWILFLHPETALAPGWEVEAENFISRVTIEHQRAAAFRFGLDDFGAPSRRREAMVGLRCFLFKLPYGDQGLLISKRLYNKLGGYRDGAMEDVDLVRRIGARRLVMLHARAVNKIRTEPRAMRDIALTALHALRFPPGVLARLG